MEPDKNFIKTIRRIVENHKALLLFEVLGVVILFYILFLEERARETKEEYITQREEIQALSEEISLLTISVEELVEHAREDTKKQIEERLDEERKRISMLEQELAEESKERSALESRLIRELGISEGRFSELAKEFAGSTLDLASIISEWRKRTVNITCTFFSGNSSGSGILIQFYEEGKVIYGVLTNRHVLADLFGRVGSSCTMRFPDTSSPVTVYAKDGAIELSTNGYDFGRLVLENPPQSLLAAAASTGRFCTARPAIGDAVIILGYPSIGGREDITATDGILSGFDGDYYVTSAKVERGNSGGPGIHLEKNCLLGIPTFSQQGVLESLARILSIDVLTK